MSGIDRSEIDRQNERQDEEGDGLYMQDILRGGITNDDPRIPANVSK